MRRWGGEAGMAALLVVERGFGGGSLRPTPHLTSPLKGGRDELGKGGVRRGEEGVGEMDWG